MVFFVFMGMFSVVRLLDSDYGSTSAEEALALTHMLEYVDIYSNSWGPRDDGQGIDNIPKLVEEALELGTTEVGAVCFYKSTPITSSLSLTIFMHVFIDSRATFLHLSLRQNYN